jgi:hypothetical protein
MLRTLLDTTLRRMLDTTLGKGRPKLLKPREGYQTYPRVRFRAVFAPWYRLIAGRHDPAG